MICCLVAVVSPFLLLSLFTSSVKNSVCVLVCAWSQRRHSTLASLASPPSHLLSLLPSFLSPSLLSPSPLTSSSLLSLLFFSPVSSFLAPCSPFLSLLPSLFLPLPHLSPPRAVPPPTLAHAVRLLHAPLVHQNILVPQNVISSLTPRLVGP